MKSGRSSVSLYDSALVEANSVAQWANFGRADSTDSGQTNLPSLGRRASARKSGLTSAGICELPAAAAGRGRAIIPEERGGVEGG